ncbi:RNA polymerase Rpb4 family protein [Methanospirillum sp. J.3.6.1-F.2.7.3]|jgi:DNA-directed RNA polymerase subunit F|uniref:DNA-directed RNA polymerase subunit Rpo4 n=2 Tax=Methanospirillum TaxID=2202 RepID=A0A8E7AX36_9EURY|nr:MULTISPECIES: RNA polymerase Rpb4 family protein [Methanospirillum]MDX8549427.1 RNA polymerase Rpb4 family protein [Methanospirillum hungatei]NLW77057.1 RNA polymerase Rpb4 family protein [Methanomicrobiales archaeon]QVV89287.1 RNA polymerase Rpb4 family protein [Methanospirillum sp. J.3.6.1-F.2.7.3]QXO93475.1 RNA polymerase Rpb4 family protein [Methanospirillum hungatei]
MKIKGILQEKAITLPELKEELLNVEAARLEKGKEMSYELRRSIEHANQISKTSAEKSAELVQALLQLDKVKPDVAYRIASVMPRTRDEVRAVFGRDKFSHTPEELDAIIDLVISHFR